MTRTDGRKVLAELEAIAQREGQARSLDDSHLPLRLEDMLAQAVEADLTLDVRREEDGRAAAKISAVDMTRTHVE